MYLKKIHVLFIAVLILIAITFFNTNIIIKEYKLHNIYGAPAGSRINLIDYYMGLIIDKIKHVFVVNSNNGLTIEEFMIPERSKENLLSDFPLNIKKWQTAYYKYPDSNFRKVKIRHRGDNPNGWAREKKSFRIKTRKKKLISNKRVINYHLPQDENIIGTYLSYYIGKKINLLTPDFELIETRINGEPSGIYFKNSQIDEIFLRRNNKMPVNIYKGEQYHTERALERSNDLFNNPSLWSKVAIFNQRSENDYTDLERFINLIRKAETSNEYYNELKIVADINEWAKFSAYQTINQSWHNDRDHNMRLISDLWSGTVTPIVHDTGSVFEEEKNKNLVYDDDPHSLYKIYHQSSEFLSLKYNYLYDFLTNDILLQTADHAKELINKLSNSWHRETNRTQFSITNSGVKRKTDQKSMESIWNKIPKIIENRNKILLDKLKEEPNASWSKTKNIISLVTKSLVPVSDVTITIKNLNSPQINVYFDRDNNGILSNGDMLIPTKREKNKIILSAEFITNRNSVKNYFNEPSNIEINKTKFNLIFSLPINVVKVEARNALTQNKFIIAQNDSDGLTPSRLNYPLIKNQLKAEKWAGVKKIEGTNIINYPVKVAPGTSILMKEGSNLIFRDKIIINGTKKNPVEIKSANSTKIWGTFALQGKKTSGSIFSYVSVSGGSGYETANNKYSGMLSIHDTSEVVLDNILLEKNKIYDDTLHFVYGNNIKINNCYINNAFADAIDIDISRILIDGCKIENSRNDGIDSMNSLVKINKSFIKGSGDKGVSIGENSNVLIMMTKLENNYIGIQTKDNSTSLIVQSTLKNNLVQSDAYQKNWQYGGGGNVEIFNTNITPIIDKISNDKKSNTYFYDSKYDSKTIGKSKNTYFIDENSQIFQNYNSSYVNFEQHLSEWNKKIIQ